MTGSEESETAKMSRLLYSEMERKLQEEAIGRASYRRSDRFRWRLAVAQQDGPSW